MRCLGGCGYTRFCVLGHNFVLRCKFGFHRNLLRRSGRFAPHILCRTSEMASVRKCFCRFFGRPKSVAAAPGPGGLFSLVRVTGDCGRCTGRLPSGSGCLCYGIVNGGVGRTVFRYPGCAGSVRRTIGSAVDGKGFSNSLLGTDVGGCGLRNFLFSVFPGGYLGVCSFLRDFGESGNNRGGVERLRAWERFMVYV